MQGTMRYMGAMLNWASVHNYKWARFMNRRCCGFQVIPASVYDVPSLLVLDVSRNKLSCFTPDDKALLPQARSRSSRSNSSANRAERATSSNVRLALETV
jgi:hypothetical protein